LDAAAGGARGHVEGAEVHAVEIGIAIGGLGGVEAVPAGVGGQQRLLERFAAAAGFAAHAAHLVQAAVQVDHGGAAGALVQAVHVLGEQHLHGAACFQCGQGGVGGVGLGLAEARPAEQAARPVALAGGRFAHEILVVHRRGALPLAVGIAVIGNARVGAAAGAGEDEQAAGAVDEVSQRGRHAS